MNKTRFQIAKRDIVEYFEKEGKSILTYRTISRILNKNRRIWRLPLSLSNTGFIDLLTAHTKLKKYEIVFPNLKILRFAWGNVSAYGMAMSLREDTYLTHYTAVYLHNLTDQIPKTIYVNYEQNKKNVANAKLSQDAINRAFSNPQRVSKNIAQFEDFKICLLNGQFSDRAGVTEMVTSENEKLMVTDVERTLIDIVVRPSYSGGIKEVLEAYRKAVGKVSINKLSAMLQKLNYTYPYHQAIGFYLQRAGVYRESQISLLKKFNFEYDFYIANQIREPEYSKEWRLYYPKGF